MRWGPGWPTDVAAASRRRILAAGPSFPLGLLSGAQGAVHEFPRATEEVAAKASQGAALRMGVCVCGGGRVEG